MWPFTSTPVEDAQREVAAEVSKPDDDDDDDKPSPPPRRPEPEDDDDEIKPDGGVGRGNW